MNDLFDFGLVKGSIRLKRCSISGTTQSVFYKLRADDGNLYILRQQILTAPWTVGVGFISPGGIRAKYPDLAAARDPHLPSVECKIENANEYARKGQNRCRDAGIDQLVQIMEQKPALVRLDASLGFGPVLKHS